MSYILDALKKADAQRQRDPARGIHAQPLGLSGAGPQPRSARGMRFWSAAAVGLLALSAAGWYLYRDDAKAASGPRNDISARPQPSLATLAQAQTAPASGNNDVAPPAVAPAAVPAPAIAPAQAINPPPAPAPAQPLTPPGADPRATSQPTMRGGPQSPTAVAPGAAAVVAQPGAAPGAPMTPRSPGAQTAAPGTPAAIPRTPAVSAPAPAAPPSPPVAGLPPDAPKLVLSGGVYSTNPAQRMLIVNGQVFNEGSEVAAGVTLEEVKARTVVLRFRGARYTVAY
jgi:general secretion pathway protein B